jgi:hypothetical protein
VTKPKDRPANVDDRPRHDLTPRWPELTGEVDYGGRFGLQDHDPGDDVPWRKHPEPSR